MSDIFLSYSRKDKAKARFIAKALEAQGYSVWWDRIIPPGKTFEYIIEEELNAAKCVVVLWSKESVSSDWVKQEASKGLKRRILVPVLIDEVDIPVPFNSIATANLIDWQGELPNYVFDLILGAVEEKIGIQPVEKTKERGAQEEAKEIRRVAEEMDEIFLSYKSEDRSRAKIIAEALERQGYSVWWDRKIPPGKTFDQVIEEKLDAAKCVIVLWSQQSVLSNWVKEEASEGLQRQILVPILIDDVKIPLGFRRIQSARLVNWQGKLPDSEFDTLLESISGILGSPIGAEKEEIEIKEESRIEAVEFEDERIQKNAIKREDKAKSTEEIPKTYANSIAMKFTLIPKGEFMMGSEEFNWAKPVHWVKIRKPFYLGIYPVTQQEWEEIMGNNPSHFKGDNLPVESMSWEDAQEFIKKLNKKENSDKYRLPSEAEWEYAARVGTTTRYCFGDDELELGDYAWYAGNSSRKTHPVGEKKPNPWGLYDMHGNVWEWVQDIYHDNYRDTPTDGSAWEGDGSSRVVRGGGLGCVASDLRSASRYGIRLSGRNCDLGFRLLREI